MILKINDRIRTRKIEFFNDVKLNLKYDAIASTFALKFYFDPDRIEHKDLACIGHYHSCTIEDEGELLMTGTILSEVFTSSSKRQLVAISGYSLPGVLEDCDIPPDISLQSDGLSLREMAEQYIKPFGLKIKIDPLAAAAMEEKYEESTAKETQSVRSYLSELAAQKNIIMSHDSFGRVLFTKARANEQPVINLTNVLPVTDMSLTFNGQMMHSDIIVIRQDDIDDQVDTSEGAILKNPYVNYIYRPRTIVQSSTKETDIDQAAKNALAQELKNLSLRILLDRWQINGKILRPGQTIGVLNKEVYLYKKTNWKIESMELEQNADQKICILNCVLPEVFTGETPKYIFQGINLH